MKIHGDNLNAYSNANFQFLEQLVEISNYSNSERVYDQTVSRNVLAIQKPFLTGDLQYTKLSFTCLDCSQKQT